MQTDRLRVELHTAIGAGLGAYLFIGLEWLFFVTKDSFFTVLHWPARISIALVTALLLCVSMLGFWLLIAAVTRLLIPKSFDGWAVSFLTLPLTLLMTTLLVLMIDNFSYTVLGFGIASTEAAQSVPYLVGILILFLVVWRKLRGLYDTEHAPHFAGRLYLLTALVTASLLAAFINLFRAEDTIEIVNDPSTSSKVNILLFASDGIQADFISGYGFEDSVTPNLDALMAESMVFEAAIAKAGRITGITVAMLSGKYPTTTKVIFPPHVLIGADAFEQLPGLLRARDYRVFQETIRYYADGPDLNMREGFDYANLRSFENKPVLWLPDQLRLAFTQVIHFATQVGDRVGSRVAHLVGQKPMSRAFQASTGGGSARVYGRGDRARVDAALDFIAESEQPFLMHIHLMDTHCCRFKPKQARFSKGLGQQTPKTREAFFLDTVIESDGYFGEIIDALKAAGKYENTLILYSSDHSLGWGVKDRMPLVLRLPDQTIKGPVTENVQLVDVAPTVLDYLGMPVPDWMEGISLLQSNKDPMRPAFSVGGVDKERSPGAKAPLSRLIGAGPPQYGINTMVLTVCQRWYALNLATQDLTLGDIRNHPQPCQSDRLPSSQLAREMIAEHLKVRGIEPAADDARP